ncbi:protein serine/threonine kinase activating protein DBF4 NDAI_0A05540 [Naumovozyma dairenensis CBS 421]|uniref:DBF4-type domain-containing protein n=1 Tax=Naumovozyma dairenensis (strain ATCC 10597 / BCRC 20456 / CBS 421 / NBRC 0211 / NRRL Y-12639) TaxID=1071378 RepID=G0W4H1_NAUDC|nr:hypothetical protein NDAI_0A05540 [Naumovozyma dairenensis CBS 421]CCD22709.1 hypothetical protein NDAI_0A05540 [Naumovozyma dairenensis CBS 421]
MVSPAKLICRSPLKETDANLKQTLIAPPKIPSTNDIASTKKRSLERLEQQELERKRLKVERARSIEGAVQVNKAKVIKKVENKVTDEELAEWQKNWRKIMKRDSKIYFDPTDDVDISKVGRSKLLKKMELLKKAFCSLDAEITSFFDSTVTIVITRRSTDNLQILNEQDLLRRAKRNYMKVWGYDKAVRFLRNLDIDIDNLQSNKEALMATPTLSNLLHNEKLYGPSDRDPKTRRDDVHYFKYSHVYMYDSWQLWAPIVILEWKPQDLAKLDELPYPTLKMGTFGRCPFIGDRNCDELSYKRTIKRYNRDKINKKYALVLRQLYQHHAIPVIEDKPLISLSHNSLDSKRLFEKWQRKLTTQISEPQEEKKLSNNKTNTWKEPSRTIPMLKHPAAVLLSRQETEEFPDDLCSTKRQSRITYEIKASGVNQSNDAATSFGNGLGPTRATVMSKNLQTLNKLVVDRKLGTRKHAQNSTKTTPIVGTPLSNQVKNEKSMDELGTATGPVDKVEPIPKKEPVRNSGYCENCKVKYDELEHHIVSEKHLAFAQNDLNFESIDCLIEKLQFQF